MSRSTRAAGPKPQTDDRALRELLSGIWIAPAVFVAHSLGLFPLLAEQPRTVADVCTGLNIALRPAEALLQVCQTVGLVRRHADRYSLTPLAEDYLLASSPTYFGGVIDSAIANYSLYSFVSVKQAVLTNAPQAYGGEVIFKSHEEQSNLAQSFTRAMHSASVAPASAWPAALDLSTHHRLLDIGGGSGAHTIGAVRQWPHLHGIIFDLAPVCAVAQTVVTDQGLQDRITTQVGDMWRDPFPAADLHFYSWIYHDWPPEKNAFLTRKSFASLPSGGRIILHETLYNDAKTGPRAAAADSVAMLVWTEGQPYSGAELAAMLTTTGFTEVTVKPTFGDWSIVTGRKP